MFNQGIDPGRTAFTAGTATNRFSAAVLGCSASPDRPPTAWPPAAPISRDRLVSPAHPKPGGADHLGALFGEQPAHDAADCPLLAPVTIATRTIQQAQ